MLQRHLGPFPHRDIERIEKIFQEKGIAFTTIAAKEALAHAEEQLALDPLAFNALRVKSFDPSWIVFEIDENDVPKLKEHFDLLGLSAEYAAEENSEIEALLGSEEYVCPHGDHSQQNPGLCPRHKIPLLKWSDWVEDQKMSGGAGKSIFANPLVSLLLVAGVAAFVYYFFLRKGPAGP